MRGVNTLPFDGKTYQAEDSPRLGKQLEWVRRIMERGEWYTPEDVQRELVKYGVRAGTASITARFRDLRKPKFGGRTIERRKRAEGLFEYRMLPKGITLAEVK